MSERGMEHAARYRTDDCDVNDAHLIVLHSRNGDWYLAIGETQDDWPPSERWVRITTSGVRPEYVGVSGLIRQLYEKLQEAE